MAPRIRLPTEDHTARIRQLETDNYMLRVEIVRLAPREHRELLESYISCESRADAARWPDLVAEKLLERVQPIPSTVDHMFGERAYCPLCGGSANSFYGQEGFKFPEGLRRHFVGFGRTHQCPVIKAAAALAREHGELDWPPG